MKKLIFKTLTEAEEVTDIVPADRIFQRYGLGQVAIPDNPVLPFLLIAELPAFRPRNAPRRNNTSLNHFFQLIGYWPKGSYLPIENFLDICQTYVFSMETVLSESGRRCLEVQWDTRSQDYDDDNYDAFVKHDTYQITGSSIQP